MPFFDLKAVRVQRNANLRRMARWVGVAHLVLCGFGTNVNAQTQAGTAGQEAAKTLAAARATADAPSNAATPSVSEPQQWRIGLGWHHYAEPAMQLHGPQLRLYTPSLHLQTAWMPRLGSEWSVADLRYSSTSTGSLDHVLGVHGQISAWWPGYANRQGWAVGTALAQAGLSLEADWIDMRGISNTGHYGYRRQGTRLWAMGAWRWPAIGELQAGVLLIGRQFSQLSDGPAMPRSSDVVNLQHRGLWLRYEHQRTVWGGALWRPFVRWSWVDTSDYVGRLGWHEPNNHTLQLGVSRAW